MKNLDFLGLPGYAVTKDGQVYSLKSNRFLKLASNDTGYTVAYLCKDCKTLSYKVHRLVALAYLSMTYFEGAHVNHKDGNKTNNTVTNLEWVDRSGNMRHAFDTGLRERKLSDQDVHDISRLLQNGARVKDVSEMFGVDSTTISSIQNRKIYKHLTLDYDFARVKKLDRLSVEKIQKICEDLSSGRTVREISQKFDVSLSTVSNIKARKIHNFISDSYEW